MEQPDIRHARTWLRDAAKRLAALEEKHNDAELGDIRSTLLDVITRAEVVPRDPQLPTAEQLNAVRRIRRGAMINVVLVRPFDLPLDYLMLTFDDGFTCGISPTGDVSS